MLRKCLLLIVFFNSKVEGHFYVNKNLEVLMLEELRNSSKGAIGGFLPAVKQIANVAALPGIVNVINVFHVKSC